MWWRRSHHQRHGAGRTVEVLAERHRRGAEPHGLLPGLAGIKTLPLRMRQHVAAATDLARRLEGAKGVRRVHYPGLASHAQHELCLRQMSGGGGIITVELDGGLEQAKRFLTSLRIFTLPRVWEAWNRWPNIPA